MKNWFDVINSETARAHKAAYEKSLKSGHAVKVTEGEYYYRGYNISKDGGRECPWNYGKPDEISHESTATKKEAMETIDCILKNKELDLCDIVCG